MFGTRLASPALVRLTWLPGVLLVLPSPWRLGPGRGLLGEPAQRVVVEFSGAGRRKRAADKHGPARRMRDHPRGGEHVGLFGGSLDEDLVEPVVSFTSSMYEAKAAPARSGGWASLLIAAE